jgi:Double zinc ribbon
VKGSTAELVERLYRKLLEALSETAAVSPSALTIADLYQHLVPYRSVRMELDVLELAQYEHALLRLLAGEGELVRVLDEDARRELAAELSSPNPILGIYRDYAGVGVELRDVPERVERRAPEPSAEPAPRPAPRPSGKLTPPTPAPADAVRVARPGSVPEAPPAVETAPEASPPPQLFAESDRVAASFPRPAHRDRPAPAARAPSSPQRTPRCVSCREPLPDVEGVRYCPHCGADQSAVACGSCGTLIQRGWKYCIRCGAPSPAGPG